MRLKSVLAAMSLCAAALCAQAREEADGAVSALEESAPAVDVRTMAGPDSAAVAEADDGRAAGAYERKSIAWLDAIWITDDASRKIPGEMLRELRVGVGAILSNARYDRNPLPEALQKRFVDAANRELAASKPSDDPARLTDLVNRFLLPAILDAVQSEAVERASDLASEEQRNSRIVDKAKELGVTAVEYDKVRNAAFLVVPMVRKWNHFLLPRRNDAPSVRMALGFGMQIWRIRVADGRAEAVPVKTVWTSAFGSGTHSGILAALNEETARKAVRNALLRNIDVEVKSLPEFRLSSQVTLADASTVESDVGAGEGIAVGDRMIAYAEYEDEDGNVVQTERGWVEATKVATKEEQERGGASRFRVVSGPVGEGDVLGEFPRINWNVYVGAAAERLTLVDDEDKEVAQVNWTLRLGFDYRLSHATGVPGLYVGGLFDFGVASMRGHGRRCFTDGQTEYGVTAPFWISPRIAVTKTLSWRRFGLFLRGEVGYGWLFWGVDGDDVRWAWGDNADEQESINGNWGPLAGVAAGLDFAISPSVSVRAGAGWNVYGWKKDGPNENYTMGNEVEAGGLTLGAILVWNPAGLPFDPANLVF